MHRIQLHLTQAQAQRLDRLARVRRTTRAALIREGVDHVLRAGHGPGDALLGLIGQAGTGGDPSVSQEHDRVLGEVKLSRRRR